MPVRTQLLAALAITLMLMSAVGAAASDRVPMTFPTVEVSALRDGETPFGKAIFLRDPSGTLTLEDALGMDGWRPLTPEERNQGITRAGFLVGFRIVNDTAAPFALVVSHNVMHLSQFALYAISPDGVVDRQTMDPGVPMAERPLDYAGPAAMIEVPAGASRDVVISLRNDFAIPLHIAVRLWSERGFERFVVKNTALSTAVAAALATTAMFWLLYGIVMLEGRLVFYSLYLALTAYTLVSFLGIGYQLVYPANAALHQLGYHWSMFLLVAAALEFARRHLELAALHPRDDRVLRIVVACNVAAAVFAVLVQRPAIEAPLTFVSLSATPIAIAWLSWRAFRHDGINYTKWMVIGWGALALMVLPGIFGSLVNVPLLSLTQMDFLHLAFAMAVFESLVLSISLAHWLRVLEVRRLAAELAAAQDPLTGLLNRRGFNEHSLARKVDEGWAPDAWIAVIDIDHFKGINDRYGHACGDAVLQRLADLLAETRGAGEVAARYGGEEFVLMYTAASQREALAVLDELRRRFAATPTLEGGTRISHSFSAGLVRAADHPASDPDGLVARADAALYAAKRAGRNRVHISA